MLQAPIMSIMAQYVKNTDVPNEDSFLWQLGNGWKISQSTGDPWAPINTITDEMLGTKLTEISDTEAIDVIDYQSYFFVPNKFISKFKDKKTGKDVEKISWSVFAFENRVKADKKLADIKKFASYQPKATVTTVPKPPIPREQTTFASKPVTASTVSPTQSTISPDTIRTISLTDNSITTFTDPRPVKYDDKEMIATLLTDGYVFLPHSLVGQPYQEQKILDMDEETGKQVEIGTTLVFLMGRIINVKIPDNQ